MRDSVKVLSVILVSSLILGVVITNAELIYQLLDAWFNFHKAVAQRARPIYLPEPTGPPSDVSGMLSKIKNGFLVSKIGGIEVFANIQTPPDDAPRVLVFMA